MALTNWKGIPQKVIVNWVSLADMTLKILKTRQLYSRFTAKIGWTYTWKEPDLHYQAPNFEVCRLVYHVFHAIFHSNFKHDWLECQSQVFHWLSPLSRYVPPGHLSSIYQGSFLNYTPLLQGTSLLLWRVIWPIWNQDGAYIGKCRTTRLSSAYSVAQEKTVQS